MEICQQCGKVGDRLTPCAMNLCPVMTAYVKAGVKWIMGPGGDEGTRLCTCHDYPHRTDCGQDQSSGDKSDAQ